jgi:hypothetical protein
MSSSSGEEVLVEIVTQENRELNLVWYCWKALNVGYRCIEVVSYCLELLLCGSY